MRTGVIIDTTKHVTNGSRLRRTRTNLAARAHNQHVANPLYTGVSPNFHADMSFIHIRTFGILEEFKLKRRRLAREKVGTTPFSVGCSMIPWI